MKAGRTKSCRFSFQQYCIDGNSWVPEGICNQIGSRALSSLCQRNLKTAFFTLKTHQMFSVNTTPLSFDLCSWKTLPGKSHDYRKAIVFEKLRFRKAGVFKFLWFEERFQRAPFLWRITVDGRSNWRNIVAFFNLSGGVWMSPLMRKAFFCGTGINLFRNRILSFPATMFMCQA